MKYQMRSTPADEAEGFYRELAKMEPSTPEEWLDYNRTVLLAGVAMQRAIVWRLGTIHDAVMAAPLKTQLIREKVKEVLDEGQRWAPPADQVKL